MTALTAGATTRPTLSLHYEGKPRTAARKRQRHSPTLSTRELRRLVAQMVG